VGKRDIACNQTNFGSEKDSLLKKTWKVCPIKSLFFLEFVSAFVGFIPMATFPAIFQYFSCHFPILPLDRTSLGECEERALVEASPRYQCLQRKLRSQNGCSKYASTALPIKKMIAVVVVSSTKERV